ncbi:hypothetical protein AB0K08_13580 [Citricoccus sp. NPDC055426]|uniref:hypothetical protein n=1 Tax=Citricoccus sp. NPDC055426 TaxID=3155536 RepID=UPI0034357782
MTGLKKYEITTDKGFPTTVKLSDADAKRRGLLGKHVDPEAPKPKSTRKAAARPRNKQAPAPANKQAPAATDSADEKSSNDAEGDKSPDEAAKTGFGAAFENKN